MISRWDSNNIYHIFLTNIPPQKKSKTENVHLLYPSIIYLWLCECFTLNKNVVNVFQQADVTLAEVICLECMSGFNNAFLWPSTTVAAWLNIKSNEGLSYFLCFWKGIFSRFHLSEIYKGWPLLSAAPSEQQDRRTISSATHKWIHSPQTCSRALTWPDCGRTWDLWTLPNMAGTSGFGC